MSKFEFTQRPNEPLTIETAVFEALGAASMSWSEVPSGIFDDIHAKDIGERLVDFIDARIRYERAEADNAGYSEGYAQGMEDMY